MVEISFIPKIKIHIRILINRSPIPQHWLAPLCASQCLINVLHHLLPIKMFFKVKNKYEILCWSYKLVIASLMASSPWGGCGGPWAVCPHGHGHWRLMWSTFSSPSCPAHPTRCFKGAGGWSRGVSDRTVGMLSPCPTDQLQTRALGLVCKLGTMLWGLEGILWTSLN